jgi:hypothetical protein
MRGREVRTGITLTALFLQAALPFIGFGASDEFSKRRAYLLPWQMIVEKFHEGGWFCGNEDLLENNMSQDITGGVVRIDPNCSYAYQPNQTITIKLPEGATNSGSLRKIEALVTECVEGSWCDIGKVATSTEPSNEIRVAGLTEKAGFFRLRFVVGAQDSQKCLETYAIVCSNWKRDILTFSRMLKEKIELDPDVQLLRSSIAISHFDHVMEMVSKASLLSGNILKALANAVWSKKTFDDGQCPDLVIGLNKIRLKRFEGAQIAEFVVFVPEEYGHSKRWPLFLHPDPRRVYARNSYSEHSGLIDIWWHFPMTMGFDWKDYKHLLRILNEKLNIDENRVYVNGECGNGIATIALALNYPDYWAECSASLGNSYRHLAGNALNLPLIFVKGGHDQDPLVGYYDFAVKCFQYRICRHFRYSKTQNTMEARGALMPQAVRNKNPQRVLFTIESLHNPRAYWVQVNGREDENLIGTIDASVDGQTIFVKTNNVDAYSLDLVQAPLYANKPVKIVENGQNLGFATDRIFTRRAEKYVDTAYIKNERLHGPVWDAFTDPYVVVWGIGSEDKGLSKASEEFAKSLANGGLCFADANMPEELAGSHNLILVGTAESNLWLSKIRGELPVRIEKGQIAAEGKRYDGRDMGFILVYPNPINLQKYVAVFSGASSRAMANISEAYSQMKSIRPADVGIFEITDTGSIKWHIIEKFNTVWSWHGEWDRVLAVANMKHPKWRWSQWIARTVREQLEVDVVVCEDPFTFEDSVPSGQITYRDLFNTFKNVWFTKVKINGKSLRVLLTVPFMDISKREVDAPVIDGVSLLKGATGAEEKVLAINELVNDAVYTVALPERCLNGQRIGLVFQNYDIVEQTYLMPMLKEYLESNSEINIDDQLDRLKFRIY